MTGITQKQLQKYMQKFPEEAATINATEHFLSATKQQAVADKVTISYWIFNPETGKILLTKSATKSQWSPIEGKPVQKFDDRLQEYTLTELKEISGLQDIQPYNDEIFDLEIQYIDNTNVSCYVYNFCFLFFTHNKNLKEQLQWVSTSEISRESTAKKCLNLFKKWQLFCFEQHTV